MNARGFRVPEPPGRVRRQKRADPRRQLRHRARKQALRREIQVPVSAALRYRSEDRPRIRRGRFGKRRIRAPHRICDRRERQDRSGARESGCGDVSGRAVEDALTRVRNFSQQRGRFVQQTLALRDRAHAAVVARFPALRDFHADQIRLLHAHPLSDGAQQRVWDSRRLPGGARASAETSKASAVPMRASRPRSLRRIEFLVTRHALPHDLQLLLEKEDLLEQRCTIGSPQLLPRESLHPLRRGADQQCVAASQMRIRLLSSHESDSKRPAQLVTNRCNY